MRELVRVAQLKIAKAKTARLFGLSGAASLNPFENKRLTAALLAVLILAVIGAWALRGAGAGRPAAISNTGSADLSTQSVTQTPSAQSTQSSVSVNSASSSSGGSSSNSSNVSVSVNGQNINVPQNGSVHKVIQNGNSTTTINATQSSTGSASNSYSDSTNLDVNDSSSSVSVQGGSQ